MRRALRPFSAIVVTVLLAAGCGGKKEDISAPPSEQPTLDTTPVTVKVLAWYALADHEFETWFKQPVQKKYPHITMELVRLGNGVTLDSLVTSGEMPDIITSSTTGIYDLKRLEIIEDLGPLIKKFGTDMGRFDPITIDSMKQYSDVGGTVGMPYASNFSALFYNKDIFDKFGVAYPPDGMTWDDAIEIGRKLTRKEDNIQYRGLNPGGADLMGYGLSLPYVDKLTNKALINTDKWKMVLNKALEIYSMPGYMDGAPGGQGQPNFLKERTTAMLGAWGDTILGPMEEFHLSGNPMNWDMATIPNFPEAKGKARAIDFHMLILSKTSKHKDQAFLAMDLVSSDEVQQMINRTTRVTVLKKTDDYKTNFGASLQSLKGKNLNAIFGVEPNVLYTLTRFDGKAREFVRNVAYDAARNQFDINTGLREAEEKLNKYIEEQLRN
jgi:multiple sugar transport system substrate-binding protein